MTKRQVVKLALEWRDVPYVPWSYGFTHEAWQKLIEHYGTADLGPVFQNHFLGLGSGVGSFEDIGGMSTQKTLPYGSAEDVRAETQRLIDMGMRGGYIFAPAHAVEGDVPLENMRAFIDTLKAQPGFAAG